MDEFFTWEMLANFAGAAAATGIITQFTKGLFSKLPTQWLSYMIAIAILAAATAATGCAEDWTGWAIIPLNAVIVSLSANGAFSAIKRVSTGGNSTSGK